MRPWQVVGVSALLINGLIMAAFVFTNRSELITSVIAAALIPILISMGLLFWVDSKKIREANQLQKINITGFFLKVILLGSWAAILLNAGTLDKVTFVVILIVNFLAWHGVEAYYWPLFMAKDREEIGENS